MFVKCLYIACIFLFVKNADDYNIYYLISTCTIILNALFDIFRLHNFAKFSLKNLSIRPTVSFFILGSYQLLTSLHTSFNIAYLGFATNTTEACYYTTATKLHSIIIALFTAFTGVMLPRMSSIKENNKKSFLDYLINL